MSPAGGIESVNTPAVGEVSYPIDIHERKIGKSGRYGGSFRLPLVIEEIQIKASEVTWQTYSG